MREHHKRHPNGYLIMFKSQIAIVSVVMFLFSFEPSAVNLTKLKVCLFRKRFREHGNTVAVAEPIFQPRLSSARILSATMHIDPLHLAYLRRAFHSCVDTVSGVAAGLNERSPSIAMEPVK